MQPCKTVLIIEDDEDIRSTLKILIESEGYEVLLAQNGAAGLAILKSRLNQKPGIVFCDLLMPVMDGLEVIAAMKSDPSLADIPLVMITATSYELPKEQEHIKKPFNIDHVLDTVRKHCGPA